MRLARSRLLCVQDNNAVVYGFAAFNDVLAAQSKPRRVQTSVVAAFAAVALLLAALGIYGLIDYSIAARRARKSGSAWRLEPREATSSAWYSGRASI
jgi:hypothetical protein